MMKEKEEPGLPSTALDLFHVVLTGEELNLQRYQVLVDPTEKILQSC